MNNKIKDILMIINYLLFTCVFLTITLYNTENELFIITLAFLFLSSYTLRVFFIYNAEKHNRLSYLLLLLDFIFIFLLNMKDTSFISLSLYYLLLEDTIINFTSRFSIIASIFSFTLYSYALTVMMNYNYSSAFSKLLLSIPVYCIFHLIFFLVKYLLRQTEIIEAALKDITLQKIEKDCVYADLKEAYEKLEVMTIHKERNKIAREIHDTVGHTLTTVLVELEASKRLMNVNEALAIEKLNLAQGQVRKGLNDIRSSVRVLEKGEELLDFYPSIEALISETELHSDVVIKSQIDTSLNLTNEAKNIVFSSLQEGLANGIRHGGSTAFLFKLLKKEDKVFFSLEDNGSGCGTLSPGFGLRAIRDRVYELKGSFNISSVEAEGFELNFMLPFSKACK